MSAPYALAVDRAWLDPDPSDAAEAEALMREEEAGIALEMARDARVRGRAVAELIRFAEQRTGLAGDADPSAVLYAIDELLGQAREAVTGKRVA